MLEFGVVVLIGLVILLRASRRTPSPSPESAPAPTPRQTTAIGEALKRERVYPSFVAGTRYKGPTGPRPAYIWNRLKVGDRLRATAEPDNPHDPDAVGLWHGSFHVGYVPSRHDWIAHSLREGDLLTIVVAGIEPSEDDAKVPFVALTVTVSDGSAHNRA